jgi:hypothetical protein
MTEKPMLTDAAKAALIDSGILPKFKNAFYADAPAKRDVDTQVLKDKAQGMVEGLQQLIDSGKLNDADMQKLSAVLARLLGALQGGVLSREALATALSEASTAMGAADSGGKGQTIEQKLELLWQKIDAYNKDIDDDFTKMRKAGVLFDEKLWRKHEQLSEYLKHHPHDIGTQKELDAVDDALLQQAEPQLNKCPGAGEAFDDAKKKSKERHQTVDRDLTELNKRAVALNPNADFDWDSPTTQEKTKNTDKASFTDVTMNDIETQNISQSSKITTEKFVRKQTNVCFRTKPTHKTILSSLQRSLKRFIDGAFCDNHLSNLSDLGDDPFKGKRWSTS